MEKVPSAHLNGLSASGRALCRAATILRRSPCGLWRWDILAQKQLRSHILAAGFTTRGKKERLRSKERPGPKNSMVPIRTPNKDFVVFGVRLEDILQL
jgi:hypothetical protein